MSHSNYSQREQQPFPRCELHNLNIVHCLPPACPMRQPSALQAIAEIEADGWAALSDPGFIGATINYDRQRAQICDRCVSRLLSHPLVQKLRKDAGVTHAA